MTGPIRVYVNEEPVDVPPGAPAEDALRQFDPALADAVARGAAQLTDARGLPLAPGTPLEAGAILRARQSARRSGHADA
jgi:hypothetical protein